MVKNAFSFVGFCENPIIEKKVKIRRNNVFMLEKCRVLIAAYGRYLRILGYVNYQICF